jgi:hypothetical protein
MPEILEGNYQLDLNALGLILNEELGEFKKHIHGVPISEENDLRAFFIAWMAVFIPESIEKPFFKNLKTFVQVVKESPEYSTSHWSKVLPLEIALYSITKDDRWLNSHIEYINYGGRSLRNFVARSLALVADKLYFADADLVERVEKNVKNKVFGWQEGVTILAISRGDPKKKVDLFQKWLKKYGDQGSFFDKLVHGQFVENDFLSNFMWIQQYVSLRLVCKHPAKPKPEQLDFLNKEKIRNENPLNIESGKNQQQEMFRLSKDPSLFNKLWQRMRAHPLTDSHIQLEIQKHEVTGK